MPTSKIEVFEKINRVVKFDKDGGGTIVRTFYIEPYTSHKTLLTALKGRMKDNGDGTISRIVPHNDPIFENFYCFDVSCIPFAPEAVLGGSPTGFDPNANDGDNAGNGQLTELSGCLDLMDDFDFVNNPDNTALTPADIEKGGIDNTFAEEGYESSGKCGAFVTAVYNPLIFMPGVSTPSEGSGGIGAPGGPFDYVNPVWEEEVITTAMGRNLFMRNPDLVNRVVGFGVLGFFDGSGLQDTFSKPESIWHLTLKRLMVPYLPKITVGLLAAKLNNVDGAQIGNVPFPAGTLCFEDMKNDLKIGPDGSTWYDLEMRFKVRMLYDEGYETGDAGEEPSKMWIDWNHHFGIPCNRITGIQSGTCSYYPVCWNGGLFQFFGDDHPLYLYDNMMTDQYASAGGHGTFNGNIVSDIFENGFHNNQ